MKITTPTKRQLSIYKRLFAGLKKRRSSADDMLFSRMHDTVFAGIECLSCANCCKTHSPLFNQKDIERLSSHLKIRPAEFVSKFLLLDEDGDWIFNTTPCPFLASDNKCSVYNERPQACREYPHTNRKNIYQLENITLKNAAICPAVITILDGIAKKSGIT
ncbi:MAG: YkgJ family cysteine cluster protein [Chitinophagales bacterium]|nr:YkgJ family cysteine cluster protein [Chitinophagales bacterium]